MNWEEKRINGITTQEVHNICLTEKWRIAKRDDKQSDPQTRHKLKPLIILIMLLKSAECNSAEKNG
ncbi:hypothetical protein GQX74_009013 [Glossina fuscipes]|nr:hypothetical protein GQX74_009013 [Glossina fuscipes]